MKILIDLMRSYNRRRLTRRHLKKIPVKTPFGFKFFGPSVMQSGNFEPTETRLLMKLFSQADIFVNVGANFGYYICLARSMGVKSVAIEPISINQKILKQNIVENNWEHDVILHPIACGNTDGKITIYGEGTGASLIPGWAHNPITLKHIVPIKKLDDILFEEKITSKSIFLIDVEGFEFEVLHGAEKILRSAEKPIIMLESGLTDHRPEGGLNLKFLSILNYIIECEYRVISVEDIMLEITPELVKSNINQNEDKLGTHNFLLIPNGFDYSFLIN